MGAPAVLLIGFAAVPLHAALLAMSGGAYWIIALQILDGMGGAMFGVLQPLVAADIARGTNRFNLCVGVLGLAAGLGATLSGVAGGNIATKFGDIGALTFAKVDDEFYGYFVANYTDKSQTTSQIKRIPLGVVTPSGHADVLLDPAPATIGLGDLVTDGSFLCWADNEGIRSMPIGGGTVTPLVEGSGFERLAVLGGTLYYIDGNAIFSVPMGGGAPSFVLGTRLFPITALYVLGEQPPAALAERPGTPGPPVVSDVALVWGRADGAVFGMFRGETTTYQEPTADFTVVSVYSTEGRVLWYQQGSPGAGAAAGPPQVLMSYGGVTTTLSSNAENAPLFSRLDVLADEAAAYWKQYG